MKLLKKGKKQKPSGKIDTIKKWSLSIAIIIVLVSFVMIGIQTFYPDPFQGKHCWDREEFQGPRFAKDCYLLSNTTTRDHCISEQSAENEKWQKMQNECQKQQDAVLRIYNRNVSIILLITGMLSLITSLFIVSVSSVAYGFSFGGIVLIFIAIVKYWTELQDFMRFIILGLILAVLVWLGYKKLDSRKEEQNSKKHK
ncbi:hypothetical protein HZB03_05295 [Candidatus Woesearchaeota archaeon]|nr:hypothetical protein [Candidatus Woesearchaeota archaeon]